MTELFEVVRNKTTMRHCKSIHSVVAQISPLPEVVFKLSRETKTIRVKVGYSLFAYKLRNGKKLTIKDTTSSDHFQKGFKIMTSASYLLDSDWLAQEYQARNTNQR